MEFSSDVIFGEILDLLNISTSYLNTAKAAFYSFFQADAVPFIEVESVLSKLKTSNYKIGVLTDVAYGMDNKFSLKDIDSISKYVNIALTSVDVGFRKPNTHGFEMLLNSFNIKPSEMAYVGDEEKDIIGANKLNICSMLINRSDKKLDYGQDYTLNSLNEILEILKNNNIAKH